MRRLTEGPTVWGHVSVWPRSPGLWERYRLTVYPPGTSPAERRALQFARTWPVAGAAIGSAGIIALWSNRQFFAVATVLGVYLGVLWAASRLTRALRSRIRTLRGEELLVAGVMTEYGDLRRLQSTLALLTDLEDRRRSGRVGPVRYEAEWAAIYNSLGADESVRV